MRNVSSRAMRVAAALMIVAGLSGEAAAAERIVQRNARTVFQRATQWAISALARLGRPPGEPVEGERVATPGKPGTLPPPIRE